jgi:hypothetical protein
LIADFLARLRRNQTLRQLKVSREAAKLAKKSIALRVFA